MAEVQIAYGEDGSIIIGKPVSGCWYAVADVLDVFPYGTGEFLREVIQEKSVAVILDQGSFGGSSDSPEDFEKVLWGQNKSVTLTYMVDHCVMTYQNVQRLFSLCGARLKKIRNMLETARVVTDGDAVTASLREQLAEARKEVSSLRIQIQMGQKKLEEKNDAFQKLLTENKQIDAENEKFRARIAELENVPQKGAESEEIACFRWNLANAEMSRDRLEAHNIGLSDKLEVKTLELARPRQELEEVSTGRGQKPIDPREKKTLLKLIHAALSIERKKDIKDRSLTGILVAKTQELYPSKSVDADTVKKKLNEIRKLYEELSE